MERKDAGRIPLAVLYGLLGLLFVWAIAYLLPASRDVFDIVFKPAVTVSRPFIPDWPAGRLSALSRDLDRRSVPPIRRGDRIVEVEGQPFSAPDNRYATFFYGELDPTTRRLDYVNAGHNAPMIFRAAGTIERLRATGPVVGLVEAGRFEQRSVVFAPGDLLLVYSDGISEAMNPADEEWGEDELAAAAKQHDDMTVVVVRMTA